MSTEGLLKKINALPKSVTNLSVWDIDDTLFLSEDTHVQVINKNKIVKKLTTKEFNGYKLKVGEKFDYSEFRDANLFFNTAKPLSNNLKKAKQALESKNTMVVILTARADMNDKKKFLNKFHMYGLDMSKPNIHVSRSGNLNMSTAAAKAEVLSQILATNRFTTVCMYDDDTKNLDSFLKIQTEKSKIKLDAYIVKGGKILPY